MKQPIQFKIARAVEKYYADLQLIIESSPNQSNWACKKTCSFCCNGPIVITSSEVLHIARKMESDIEPLINLEAHLKSYLDCVSKCKYYFEHSIPCVFLKDEICLIYKIRPSVCRKYFV